MISIALSFMPLQPPATDFSDLPLHTKEVSVTSLKRVGRRNSGEPYFGRHAAYRFDDPDKQFGTCYCGQQLDTAIAETVLHDEIPEKGEFKIRQEEIDTRYLVTFAAGTDNGTLKLADLTGQHLKRLGGDNSLSAEYPYDMTQRWSAAVHAHPDAVDGFITTFADRWDPQHNQNYLERMDHIERLRKRLESSPLETEALRP